MTKKIKKIVSIVLVVMTIALCACGTKIGLIKEATDATDKMTAYLFTRKVEGKVEYCLTLLEKDETLDMAAEPNIHKSPYEFDFDWNETMLAVMQNEKEETVEDVKEFGDIIVVYGKNVEIEE